MLSITDLKKGTLLQLDGVPYRVVEYAQKQVGRGGSIVNVRIKNLLDGSVQPKTFKGADKIDEAEVTNHNVQYLYSEGTTLHLMDNDSFEQYEVEKSMLGIAADFLTEGCSATAQFFSGQVINLELPVKVALKVTDAPDVVKGDTQSTVQKEVTLESGAKIQAPIFIKSGDTIMVDTRDGSYVERQK